MKADKRILALIAVLTSKFNAALATMCCCLPALVLFATGVPLYGQTVTGAIAGSVTDTSGAVVVNAAVTITNKATNAVRTTASNATGLYGAPALEAGDYRVRVEVQGFQTLERDATVVAGTTTTVDARVAPGEARQVVTVQAATAEINYETNNIQNQVELSELQSLPLNGRSFVQLASLEPGVTVATGDAQHNALFTVSVLGGGIDTVVTMDGGNVSNNITNQGGETAMNFSQEEIQEFQLSSANFDLSTPIIAGGAINVVTRSGSNDFHGAAYFYFRDHNMAAYPSLAHFPGRPSPFFARRNPGAWLSGPIRKNKLFFFFNYEYMNQVQSLSVYTTDPSMAALQGAWGSPYRGTETSLRLDYTINSRETLFFRYSDDRNINDGVGSAPAGDAASWSYSRNWADQYIMGLTSVIKPTLVNDLHLNLAYWFNHTDDAPPGVCSLPCQVEPLGTMPSVFTLVGSNFPGVGPEENQPQSRATRRYEVVDALSWQRGSHRFKFGADINLTTNGGSWDLCNPMCVGAWSEPLLAASYPQVITAMNIPKTFTTDTSVLQLPVYNLTPSIFSGVGVGDDVMGGLYHNPEHQRNDQLRAYFQDVWKIRPNFTFNFGVAWNSQLQVTDTDVAVPQYLAPLVGAGGLGRGHNYYTEFQPALGFAWTPFKDGKTVIRGGGGIYWDSLPGWNKWRGVGMLGPPGAMRTNLSSFAFTNTLPGITDYTTGSPLPIGAPINLNQLYNISVSQFLGIVQSELPAFEATVWPINPPKSGPYPYSGIEYLKQGLEIQPANIAIPRSYQTSIGVQRDLGRGFVMTADWARRQAENTALGELDWNDWNLYQGTTANVPKIPVCKTIPDFNPKDQCSTGPITLWTNEGRSVYEGLLVKVSKRLTGRVQLTASYALQNLNGVSGVVEETNWLGAYGPLLAHQNLNISGVINLPWGFHLSVNSAIITRVPVLPTSPGLEIPGTAPLGASEFLPELTAPTLSKSALAAAVAGFNATYAGTPGANGAPIKALALPPNFNFSSPLFSQDFRFGKLFQYKERIRLDVFAEMFNALNIANLSGYSASLDARNANPAAQVYAFGQPTQRIAQTFGSGGPRALQLGARFSF